MSDTLVNSSASVIVFTQCWPAYTYNAYTAVTGHQMKMRVYALAEGELRLWMLCSFMPIMSSIGWK